MIEIQITVRRDGKKFDYETVTSGNDAKEVFYQLARGTDEIMRAIDRRPREGWLPSIVNTHHIEAE